MPLPVVDENEPTWLDTAPPKPSHRRPGTPADALFVLDVEDNEGESPLGLGDAEPQLPIFIEMASGERLTQRYAASDTVSYIKVNIQATEGIASHEYQLLFQGQVLHDRKRLIDYNIVGGAVSLQFRDPVINVQDTRIVASTKRRTRNSVAGAAADAVKLVSSVWFSGEDAWSDTSNDKWDDPAYTGANRTRKETNLQSIKKSMGPLSGEAEESLERRALENLKIDVGEKEPSNIKVLRCCFLLPLAVAVEKKRIRIQEEPLFAPDMHEFVTSLKFDFCVACVILLNLYMIGVDTYYAESERPLLIAFVDHVLLIFYCAEIVCRVIAHEWVWFFELWSAFDVAVIMFTGVMPLWILGPVGFDASWMRRFGCARALRLQRACRRVRINPVFKDAWSLVQGLCAAGPFLFWCLVVVGMVHYVFAVAFVENVGKSEVFQDDEHVQHLFGSMGDACLTLFLAFTFDGWASMARFTIEPAPITATLWCVFLGVASLVLFNLMTAIIVKNSVDALAADVEAVAFQKTVEQVKSEQFLMNMFEEMDEDGSGILTLDEFEGVLGDVSFMRHLTYLDIDIDDLPDIFEILDDGDGQVVAKEFVGGMMKLQGPPKGMDMLLGCRSMQSTADQAACTSKHFEKQIAASVRSTAGHLTGAQRSFNELQACMAEFLGALDTIGSRHLVQTTLPQVPKTPLINAEKILDSERHQPKQEDAGILPAPNAPNARSVGVKSDSRHKVDGNRSVCMQQIPAAWTLQRMQKLKEKEVEAAKRRLGGSTLLLEDVGSATGRAVDSKNEAEDSGFTVMGALQDGLDALSLDVAAFNPNYLRLVAKIPREELLKRPTSVESMPRAFSREGRRNKGEEANKDSLKGQSREGFVRPTVGASNSQPEAESRKESVVLGARQVRPGRGAVDVLQNHHIQPDGMQRSLPGFVDG